VRPRLRQSPDPQRVGSRPLHSLLRDYPELDALVHEWGVDVRTHGADSWGRVLAHYGIDPNDAWLALRDRVAWRDHALGQSRAVLPNDPPRLSAEDPSEV